MSFSPDGSLLFGASNFPTPTVDIFDFNERRLIRSFSFPQAFIIHGAWVAGDYYIYGHAKTAGRLWRVKAESQSLEKPVRVDIPHAASQCGQQHQAIFGAKSRIFLFEVFGAKDDRRVGCTRAIPGGAFSVDPHTGGILAHLASDFHFWQLISSANGDDLYGIDVRDPNWHSVAVVRINPNTGNILVKRDLASDVWFIGLATIPKDLVPYGPVRTTIK